MTEQQKKKLVAANAAIWALAILFSYILSRVADVLTESPSEFLRTIMFALPLAAGMWISTSAISKAVGDGDQVS